MTSIAPTAIGDDDMYEVVFRLSSGARRVTQRERFVIAYMLDGTGRRYEVEATQGAPPFDTEMRPGEYIVTRRFFRVPAGTPHLGVVVGREGDFGIPRHYIIGQGPFHRPPIVYAS